MNALVEAPAPRGLSEATVVAGAPIRSLVPTSLEGAWRVAQLLAASPFTPRDMKAPEACAAAIMFGMDLGITPVQAVQSIAVINGRPSIWGDLALALVRADSRCEDVEEAVVGEGDSRQATCIAKRKGSKPTIRTFSVGDAQKAGLWGKAGPWQQYPSRMLQLRARAFALRDAFPDILKGIAIREEVEDIPVREVQAAPPPPPPMPAAPAIEHKPTAPEASAAAPQTAEPPAAPAQDDAADPDAILATLADQLAVCTDETCIEEGYAYLDVEAELAGFHGYVEKARALKTEHLARVAKRQDASADDLPPPPPADDEAAPSPPPSSRDFDLGGWRDIAAQQPYVGYAEALVDYAKSKRDMGIFETFWTDSQTLRAKLVPLKDRSALKDHLLNRWEKA